jgi:cytochrome c biogenesis protein CcmG/thiol:disulfide interchange protein DsbE
MPCINLETPMKKFALVLFAACMFSFGCVRAACAEGIVGGPAPDFSVKLVAGQDVNLAQFKGRPLILIVAASWCPHCQHEMPSLAKAYDEYKGDIDMLVVFVKSPKKDVEKLVAKHALKAKVGFDPDGLVGKAYGVRGIPDAFFIDSQGKVVDDYVGSIEEDELTKKIEALTKKE